MSVLGNLQLELAYSIKGLVHYLHGRVQADMELEKRVRILHLDPQAAEAIAREIQLEPT